MSKKSVKTIPHVESSTYAKNHAADTTPIKVGRTQRTQNPAKGKN